MDKMLFWKMIFDKNFGFTSYIIADGTIVYSMNV